MKSISLTQGKVALVDDADYEWLSQWKWQAAKSDTTWYAVRKGGTEKQIRMHRVIVNAPDGVEVDHKDGNGLHNWRSNLRECSHTQNLQNRAPFKTNTQGYKGVYRYKGGYWRAKIGVNKKQIHLGTFNSAKEAAQAYDEAARKYHGEYAWLNFPEQS